MFVLFQIMSNFVEIDDTNPITNPFYYAQDVDGYLDRLEEQRVREQQQTASKSKDDQLSKPKKSKKRKSSTESLSTYIIRRKYNQTTRHLVKINIYEIKDQEADNDFSDSDNPSVSVQYIVEDGNHFNDIRDATNSLIKKIGKTLYECE